MVKRHRSRLWSSFLAGLIVILGGWAMPWAAHPLLCDQRNGQQVCLERLERSAQRYWQYWVYLSIDGTAQGRSVYDCRRQQKLTPAGLWQPLVADRVDRAACQLQK